MAKDRKSRDQKRKDKLAKRNQRSPQTESLVYKGNKYKTEELVKVWLNTEIGIYETYVITDRKLLDSTVYPAIESLIRQMRSGTLPPLADSDEVIYDPDNEEEFIICNIRNSWARRFADNQRPPKDKLIGVLRSILGSIETMRAAGPKSQSYLRHIAGFLTEQIGVTVEQYDMDMTPIPEPEDSELLTLGRRWLRDDDQDAHADFRELAENLIADGAEKQVIDDCHELIGEMAGGSANDQAELMGLSMRARKSDIVSMG